MQIHGFYNWPRIAARTEKVYEAAVTTWRDDTLMGRFCRYYQCGSWFGKICCCVAAVVDLYWRWLELLHPRSCIDKAVDFQTPHESDKLTERDKAQKVESHIPSDIEIRKAD